MKKLKLQMQMTLDGFVAGPNGELDWMWVPGKRDEAGLQKVIDIADSCDTLLLGRKMTREFVDYWEGVVDNQPESQERALATRMVDLPKIVFSRTQTHIPGRNLRVENGDLATVVQALKKESGKDILVYGGADFVRSLIEQDLVDEYYIFRNPVAIGKGLPIFTGTKRLELENSLSYANGKVLSIYKRV